MIKKITILIIGLITLSGFAYAQTPGGINVYQGGTGYTSIPQYGWLSGGGTGALRLVSSTSPTVGYLTATSTTATSTFGVLNVLTRLGVGTTTGSDALNLVGDFNHNGSDVESIENNKSQAGALMFDGFTTNARAYYTLNQDIGTASTTLFIRFKVSPNPGANVGLLALSSSNTAAAAAYGFGVFIDSVGKLSIRLFGSSVANLRTIYFSQANLQSYANQIIDLVIVKRNLSTTDIPLVYINGILQTSSGSDSSGTAPNWNDTIVSTYALIGARSASAIYNDRIYKAQVFNRALSEADILQLRERGIASADQWGNLTGQTSGTLTRGKRYVITTYVAGDDFTNIGASSNGTGVEFTTTGTTPTTWTNGSTLNEIGAILDANLEFVNPSATTVITDNSSNSYVGTVTATGVYQVKPTYQINNLFFDRTTGNVGIGTTTPTSKLHVSTGISASAPTYRGVLTVDSGQSSTAANGIEFVSSASGGVGYGYRLNTVFDGSSNIDFNIQTRQSSASWTNQLTVRGLNSNVGISSSTPYAKLSVTNTGTAPSFIVEDSTSPDSTPFIIDASGNVGIGITSPATTLHVLGGGVSGPASSGTTQSSSQLRLQGGGGNNVVLDVGSYSTTGMWLQATNRLDLSAEYPILINPNGGNVGIGTTTPYALLSVTNTTASPSFIVEDSTSPDSTPFIIDASGNVGIGTSSPSEKLQVHDSSDVQLRLVDDSAVAAGIGGGLSFSASQVTNGPFDAAKITLEKLNATASHSSYDLAFWTKLDNQAITEKMRITSSGNLGIGTTSPYAKLSIAGSSLETTNLFAISTSTASATSTVFEVTSQGQVKINNAVPYYGTGGNTAIACYMSDGSLGHITITSLLASGDCVGN